jgi:hypothetical protein
MPKNNIKKSATRRRKTPLLEPRVGDLQHQLEQNKEQIAKLEMQKKTWLDHLQSGQQEYEKKKVSFETLKSDLERARKNMNEFSDLTQENVATLAHDLQDMEQRIKVAQEKQTALRRELNEKTQMLSGNELLEEKREILKREVSALAEMKTELKECKAAVESMRERNKIEAMRREEELSKRRREAEQEEAAKKRQEEEAAKKRQEEEDNERRRRFEDEFMRSFFANFDPRWFRPPPHSHSYRFHSSHAPPPQQNQTNQTRSQPRNVPADDPDDGICPINRAFVDKWLNELYKAENKASLKRVYRKGALLFHPDKFPPECKPSYVNYGEEIFKVFLGYYELLDKYFDRPSDFFDGKPEPPVAPTKKKNA